MSLSVSADSVESLQACVTLTKDLSNHSEASQAFRQLRDQLAGENPLAAEMINILWQEVISARRSAAFWEQICNVEREMTEKIAANHFNLQQNYLRLLQEQ